jgi:DNA-binding NarL/FixJ family response regulator
VKILIVDNLVLFREGLISILDRVEGFKIVGEASSVGEAVKKAKDLAPDVVLIEYYLPDGNGIDAIKTILEHVPETKCIVLTESESEDFLLASIRAGAIGYILKATPGSKLITTLRAIERGEAAISRSMTLKVLEEFHRLGAHGVDSGSELDVLTNRELEVLELLKEDLSNTEIADKLVISTNTVKVHVHNIMKKLNVANRRLAGEIAKRNF